MFFTHWPVLLVDDDPDVLSITRLAIKNFEVYGLPLKIYTAASKQEAIALMNDNVEVGCSLAVAFLDVVMETDSAGLELCDYIRNGMANRITQIFVRTGQPGICPERKVIDQYDINGYFTKMETTEDKLYSLIKSSIRQYLTYGMAAETLDIITQLQNASGSQRQIRNVLSAICGVIPELEKTPRWIAIDGQLLNSREEVEAEINTNINNLISSLCLSSGVSLNPEGDRYITDAYGNHVIHIKSAEKKADTVFLFMTRFDPPPTVIEMMHALTNTIAIIWKQSRND
jgi:CheY-like chemotaxis protein